jgi:5-methylcytosine-specific restriction endonuclease McrA
MNPPVPVTCARCSKSFEMAHWRFKKVKTHYCSKACAWPPYVITCAHCGKEKRVSPSAPKGQNNSYCGRRCAGLAGVAKNPILQQRARVDVTCGTCGISFSRQRNAAGEQNYCSRQCFHSAHAENMSGPNSPNWKGGNVTYGPYWKEIAEQARARDGYVCQRCGVSQEEIGEKLDVHHRIPLRYWESHEYANQMDNLVSLCGLCHKTVEWQATWVPMDGGVICFQHGGYAYQLAKEKNLLGGVGKSSLACGVPDFDERWHAAAIRKVDRSEVYPDGVNVEPRAKPEKVDPRQVSLFDEAGE